MTSGQYDIHPATSLQAPPVSGEARPDSASDTPATDGAAASSRREVQTSKSRALLRRLWGARGLFGGVLAIIIAWFGQMALVTQNDYVTSTRNYVIAIVILILSLMHPSLPAFMRRGRSQEAETVEKAADSTTLPVATVAASDPAPLPAEPVPGDVSTPVVDTVAERPPVVTNALPVRKAGSRSAAQVQASTTLAPYEPAPETTQAGNGKVAHIGADEVVAETAPATDAATATRTRTAPWTRYKSWRDRIGWRVTAPGLVLTSLLAGASFWVLWGDTAAPLGGWLWAASLLALLVTFLGAPGWPRGEGLLPNPWSDWMGKGVPTIPWRIEVALVLLMMGLASFLRLWNLEYHPGIFGDEGERGMDGRAILEGRPANIFGFGWWYVPNMYFYVISVFLRVFGDNLFGNRMVSVVSGLVAVWFVYKIGRLLWGPRAGLIAGVMMAVSPLALQFSRLAGESTPTGALWVVGAYFLLMALRYRRWSDWVLAGFFWSFNLYFYPSGKMIIPLAGAVALYALIRWRLDFFKKYFLGFALMGLAFGLTFMPYGVVSAKDNWYSFMGRANETSIFSPGNQGATFARYGLTYDPSWAGQSMVENLKSNPAAWGGLIYQQMRETLDGVYRRGDQVPFYNIPGIPAMAPLWAVLGLLGLAYATWKLWDARFGMVLLWLVVGMSATYLTVDAPNYQRFTNAWPAMILLPAMLIDRIAAGGWPLSISFARKWAVVPILALLVFIGGDAYREYFIFYPTTCPYCRDTVQARFAEALGQEYKAYQMGVGGWDVYFTYGSTRFVAKGVEGTDMVGAADGLPIIDNNGKGAAFIIYGNNVEYLPLLRELYPGGTERLENSQDGVTQFTSYKVPLDQLEASRRLHATYKSQSGGPLVRDEPGVGTTSSGDAEWSAPAFLTYPASAEWRGGLVAPAYGSYTFALDSSDPGAQLELDGRTILQGGSGGPTSVQVVLAKGLHDVRLTGTLSSAQSKIDVGWASGSGTTSTIDGLYLYNGPTGGLTGEIGAPGGGAAEVVALPDPFANSNVASRRSDPFLGYREGSVIFGNGPFLGRWQGKLNVQREGDYGFAFNANQPATLIIDGKTVLGSGPDGSGPGFAHLTQEAHDIDVRYASQGGSARFELLWTRPEGKPEIIPPSMLSPAQRSWTIEEVTDAPPANMPTVTQQPESKATKPQRVLSEGGLSQPRGLGVDSAGNTFVGDNGNHRVVVYSPEGKVLHTWGTAAPTAKEGEAPIPAKPGEFGDILDVAVTEDGTVYVFDSTARVQAFSASGEFIGSVEPGQLGVYAPNGIGLAPAANGEPEGLLIAVTGQNRLLRVPSPGAINSGDAHLPNDLKSIEAGDGGVLEQPVDAVADPSGTGFLYAIDLKDRIVQLTPQQNPDGTRKWTISRQWDVPVGRDYAGSRLGISPDGQQVYISDPDRKRVAVLDVGKNRVTYYGSEGKDEGQFGGPSGIAVGPDGRIYVLDRANNNVQVFDLTAP